VNTNLNNLFNSLHLIKPELTIFVVIVLLVLVDLISNKNKKYLPYISLAGLILAGYYIIVDYNTTAFAFSYNNNFGMLAIDPFGNFFKGIVIFASIIIVFFSLSSSEIKQVVDRHGEYYTLIFGMILGMFIMISAVNLIVIYLALELVSLSSYVLAGFTQQSLRNSEASLKYAIYGGISSGIMLFGISLIFGITGSINLYQINSVIRSIDIPNLTFLFAGLLVFTGIGFKVSAAPFHFWTPDVYEGAPLPFTAYLSIASKAAGFALLIRFIRITFISSIDLEGSWHLLSIIDWKSIIVVVSILTMTLGNFSALWQNNMKRLLAYSSIAHAGYLLLGLAVMSNEGLTAMLIYFVVYAFMNLGAFLIVMLIANKIGSEELDDYKGLGYSMPFLGVSLAIFLVSLIGLPPTAGFIGKLFIFISLVNAKMIIVAIIALLNTVVSLYYYIRVLRKMFLDKPQKEIAVVPVKPLHVVFIVAMIAPVLILGVYFTPLLELAKISITMLGL